MVGHGTFWLYGDGLYRVYVMCIYTCIGVLCVVWTIVSIKLFTSSVCGYHVLLFCSPATNSLFTITKLKPLISKLTELSIHIIHRSLVITFHSSNNLMSPTSISFSFEFWTFAFTFWTSNRQLELSRQASWYFLFEMSAFVGFKTTFVSLYYVIVTACKLIYPWSLCWRS